MELLEVLMFIFSNYVERNKPWSDREDVSDELEDAGFDGRDIDKALTWWAALGQIEEDHHRTASQQWSFSVRIFSGDETERLNLDVRRYLYYLENRGVLTLRSRELVIDRAMALPDIEITPAIIKWLVLVVLYSEPLWHGHLASMEQLVLEKDAVIH